MYETKLNDSQLSETTFVLCNQDTVQQNQQGARLNQITQDRNFDARKDRTASGVPIRRKADERSKNNDGITGGCRQWVAKGKCSKGASCSSKHDINKKSRGKGKRDRPSSPSQGPRSQGKDNKDEKRCNKRKSPKRHQSVWFSKSAFVFQQSEGKVHETVMQLLASRPNVSNTRRMKVVNFGKVCVSSVTTTKHQGTLRKKRTRHLKITILQFYAVIPNWVVHLRTSNYQNKRLDLRT